MDPVTILAGAKAILELVKLICGEEQFDAWTEKIDAAIRNGVTIEQALRLVEQISTVVGSGAAQKIRMRAAADLNPHARKSGFGLVLALIGLGMAGGLTSCATHAVRTVAETDDRVECYAVEWPADASRNPEHYWTETIDGRMITTVPKVQSQPDLNE